MGQIDFVTATSIPKSNQQFVWNFQSQGYFSSISLPKIIQLDMSCTPFLGKDNTVTGYLEYRDNLYNASQHISTKWDSNSKTLDIIIDGLTYKLGERYSFTLTLNDTASQSQPDCWMGSC